MTDLSTASSWTDLPSHGDGKPRFDELPHWSDVLASERAPSSLEPPPRIFVGRGAELEELRELVLERSGRVAVTGGAGTSLQMAKSTDDADERTAYLAEAREIWLSIYRTDLVARYLPDDAG